MSKRYNQVKNKKIKQAGKSDEQENVELGQLLRTLDVIVHREWFILFMPDGRFLRVQEKEPKKEELAMISPNIKYRHPDFMIFEKLERNKRGKLLCCMENDGNIHRIKYDETANRNEQYKTAEIPLLIITKERVTVSVFDEAYNLLKSFLEEIK